MRIRAMAVAAAAVLLGGCTIADVAVQPSEDRLVVEAVLQTDFAQQIILLHRSVQSASSAGERGAEVVVTTGEGRRIVFAQTDAACFTVDPRYLAFDSLQVGGTCYISSEDEGSWVQPGGTYDLRVRTARGEEAFARTVVPGRFRLYDLRAATSYHDPLPVCSLPPETPLPLRWTPSPGAWGYLAPLQIYGLRRALPDSIPASDQLELLGLAITARDTTLVLPGEFGVFDRFDLNQSLLRVLQRGLPLGTSAKVALAAADRNYINGVRGGTFNPSGQVRISSIVGDGVGVFGSLTVLRFGVVVGGPDSYGPCAFPPGPGT